jgi:hypothetical protein
VFAWTALRHLNGALAIRADKLVGPNTHIALHYSRKEFASKRTEAKHTTEELVTKWKNYNMFRAVILLFGTLIGAYALAIEASTGATR